MTEQSAPTIDESRPDPIENEHRYDPAAAQQRWQAFWEATRPSCRPTTARPSGATCSTCSRTPPATCTWATPRPS